MSFGWIIVNILSVIMQMAHNKIYISISLLASSLDHIVNLHYHEIPFGNGIGKLCLDSSYFPCEDFLDIVFFLQAYQNWLMLLEHFVDEGLARGWHDHHACMLTDNSPSISQLGGPLTKFCIYNSPTITSLSSLITQPISPRLSTAS